MSTTKVIPAASTAASTVSSILTILQGAGGYVSLGIQLAGVFIPLAKALINKIESIGAGNVTITFTDLVAADQAELATIVQTANADVNAINAELVRMGFSPLPVSSGTTAPAGVTAPTVQSLYTLNGKPL